MPAGYGDEKDVREMVSFVDVESENILKAQLMPLVGAGFYGEESGQRFHDLAWVVDPDGTTNYLSGVDHFGICCFVENSLFSSCLQADKW